MRIQYSSDEIRIKVNAIQSTDQELYNKLVQYLRMLRELDFDEMIGLIDDEQKKANNQRWIKKLNCGKYEFRIPPKHKHKVLRVVFELGEDLIRS